MTNREIAKYFDLIAKLMDLHKENSFRIRTYQNAYNTIRQINDDLFDKTVEELIEVNGIGKSIAAKIFELKESGTISSLEKLYEKTPAGILDLMKLKGLGPKKIRLIWKELGVESLGELEYSIKENHLTLLKGFGLKTQDSIIQQIAFLNLVKGNHLIHKAEKVGQELLKLLNSSFEDEIIEITGDLRRKMPFVSSIKILSTIDFDKVSEKINSEFELIEGRVFFQNICIEFIKANIDSFGTEMFLTTGPERFTSLFNIEQVDDEAEIFIENNIPVIAPVFRDNFDVIENVSKFESEKYIKLEDIKGVIHNHSVWSDGANKVIDLAEYYKKMGYTYMVMSDHSKSAFYANGVKEDQIDYYLEDISKSNDKIDDFKIFSGIESDILMDGSLDYTDDILEKFDVVISSIHSVLRMDKEKATNRLVNAINNPFTRILGHMTGRILLAREGYPLDLERVFEACAKNNVVIELNANPHRLDIDWTLISQVQEMGIKISINPDAHRKEEVENMKYGVMMAQKGGLLEENCLNAKDLPDFEKWMH